jgi:glyoxylase-like metal-dependent hydrolase (beta-lactamase superfamily II)
MPTEPVELLPEARAARVGVLQEGYLREEADGQHVGSTVGLVRDGDLVLVVDPGFVPSRAGLLDRLADLGVAPGDVTDIVISHHHPDHTVNIALFPEARVHDHWAVYTGDLWDSRDAHGAVLSPSVRLARTPGHTAEDISTIVGTAEGLLAFTHTWWTPEGPVEDPYTPDQSALDRSRALLAGLVDTIVPGHGAAFPVAAAPVADG